MLKLILKFFFSRLHVFIIYVAMAENVNPTTATIATNVSVRSGLWGKTATVFINLENKYFLTEIKVYM